MKIKSLKNKILIFVILIIFIFGLAAAFIVSSYSNDNYVSAKKEEVALSTVDKAARVGEIFNNSLNAVVSVSNDYRIVNLIEGVGQSQKNFESIVTGYNVDNDYSLIYLVDTKANIIIATDAQYVGDNVINRNYITQALGGKTAVEMLKDSKTKVPGYYFASKIVSSNGELIGAAVMVLKSEVITSGLGMQEMNSMSIGDHVHMMVDEYGVIVDSSESDRIFKSLGKINNVIQNKIDLEKRYDEVEIIPLDYQAVQDDISTHLGVKTYQIFDEDDDDQEIVSIASIGSYPFSIVMEVKMAGFAQNIANTYYSLGFLVLFAAICAAFIIFLLVGRFLKPLKELKKAALKISENDFDYLPVISSGDELEEVGTAFIKMSQAIKKSFAEIDEKVNEQTRDIVGKQSKLEDQRKAVLNILEDMGDEKNKTMIEKEKLSRILQSIGDGVFVVDHNRNIIMFNNAAEQITGYIAGEVYDHSYKNCIKLQYDDSKLENDIIERVFATGKILELGYHTVLVRKDGSELPIDDSVAPILDRAGNVSACIMVFRDATKEREIDRQKSEFVSVASHQLRTPLTSLKWFIEMLLDGDAGKINKEQTELLQQTSDSTERMISLVNSLLNVSRIESGRVSISPTPTDLGKLIGEVIAELGPLIDDKKQNISFTKVKLPLINIDAKLVRETIMNLISNAVKYTPKLGKVSVNLEKDHEYVIFSIKDSGIGIPQAQQKKIFSKFFRADNAVLEETEGTGMGLYVCKSIIELSGGKIWFKSELKKGTTFFFTLPLKGSIIKEGEKSLI